METESTEVPYLTGDPSEGEGRNLHFLLWYKGDERQEITEVSGAPDLSNRKLTEVTRGCSTLECKEFFFNKVVYMKKLNCPQSVEQGKP